jgi:hypothetical protein
MPDVNYLIDSYIASRYEPENITGEDDNGR